MAINISAPILGISRLRIKSDGEGIRTLVAFYGCPLQCRYCLNTECHDEPQKYMTAQELYDKVKIDDTYFRCSQGGITFGGGEPLLYPQFIVKFKKLCHNDWSVNVETSLNVPLSNLQCCYDVIDNFIVDIKCVSERQYISYTGKSNQNVIDNLKELFNYVGNSRIVVRIPHIPDMTQEYDIENAVSFVKSIGITNIDIFDYILPNKRGDVISKQLNHGKEICNSLKKLRKEIANSNGLVISSEDCNYQGPCLGTCPRCDSELATISQYLSILEKNNIPIHIKSNKICY